MAAETKIVRTVLRFLAVCIILYAITLIAEPLLSVLSLWNLVPSVKGVNVGLGRVLLMAALQAIFYSIMGQILFKFSGNIALLITRN